MRSNDLRSQTCDSASRGVTERLFSIEMERDEGNTKSQKKSEKSLDEEVFSKNPLPESVIQRENVQTQPGEGEIMNKTLPEHLVEKIVAMVPFPYIFKARVLSKSWLARFSPISSQEDEEKERHAISFQREVGKWSSNWSLASWSPTHLSEMDLIALDQLAIVCDQYFDPGLGRGSAISSLSEWEL